MDYKKTKYKVLKSMFVEFLKKIWFLVCHNDSFIMFLFRVIILVVIVLKIADLLDYLEIMSQGMVISSISLIFIFLRIIFRDGNYVDQKMLEEKLTLGGRKYTIEYIENPFLQAVGLAGGVLLIIAYSYFYL